MPRDATYDDYFKRNNQINEQNAENPQTTVTEDYYKMAKDQEYKLLLDKEVQLENAKNQAMKYTQNQTNALGFGGTGYGSSQNTGIYNNYMNRAMEAQKDYNENIEAINLAEKQELEQKANERFESITTMFENPDATREDIDTILGDYGYIEKDENGNIVRDENGNVKFVKPEGISDDDWYQMQYYYRMRKNAFDAKEAEELENSDNGYTGKYYSSLEDLKNVSIHKQGGKEEPMGDMFSKETPIVYSHLANGDVKKNGIVKMSNKPGDVAYLKLTANGIRVATEAEYNSSTNKYELRRDDKDKYSWLNHSSN